jgi:hypothetical protein
MKHGLYIRVNFFVLSKFSKRIFKKHNMAHVIKMHSTITIVNIPPFDPFLVPMLHHEHNIKKFSSWFHKSWSFATHFVVVLGIIPEFN